MHTNSAEVIIVNYNSTDYTIKCIDSIYQNLNMRQVRITVIDNNSKDAPDKIIDKFPDIRLHKNLKNIGFGNAINLAIKHSNAKYYILLNPDTLIIDRSLHKIIDYLDKHKKVAIASPKILDWDGSIQGSARRFPTVWTSIFGRKSPLTRLFPRNPITKREFICFNGKKHNAQTVDWVSGACMVVKRNAIKQVGGFDKRFFMYWEDADLCKRLWELGWEIIYYRKAQVFHLIGKSSDTRPLLSIYHFHKSCYYYFAKHASWPRKAITPLALLGLGLRCLFVMGLNSLQRAFYKSDILPVQMDTVKTDNSNYDKKKVLRIISRLNIGGPSIHCSILTTGLSRHRFVSKLLSGSISPLEGDMSYLIGDNDESFIKVPELQREIKLSKDIKAFIQIVRILFREKPDIVHTHMAKAGAISRSAVFFHNAFPNTKKIKTVHTYHGHVLDGYFSPLKSNIFIGIEKALGRITDAIIAISQTQKWELTKKFKLASTDKVHLIQLGFNLTKLVDIKDKGSLRSLLGLGDDTILIGIVGRLVPIKNHVLFLDSAKLINERYPDKSIRFIIVGDGELRNELEDYARKLGIDDKVIFYGWEKKILKIYADLDVLLLTSNNEGTPVSIIESMAASVPVVTTGVGGVKDLLGRIEKCSLDKKLYSICERGILCPKGNPEAVANGIAFSIENDNSVRIQRAKKFVLETYSDRQLIHSIEQLYESLLHA